MKIIHLSDPHITPPGTLLKGIDPGDNLRAAIAQINTRHQDADWVMITGDLTHSGRPEEYQRFAELLAPLSRPWHAIPGNHDDRDAFRHRFPTRINPENDYLQQVITSEAGDWILLDSLSPGHNEGLLCPRRLAWLKTRLRASAAKRIYIALHHPVLAVGLVHMDRIRLRDAQGLLDILTEDGRVKHLFFGHLHRPAHGVVAGIPWTCAPSTFYQLPFSLTEAKTPEPSLLAPALNIVLIEGDRFICHVDAVTGAVRSGDFKKNSFI